jgi:hypothetical protein
MTKESDHSANLSKAREMLLVERRQLAAELTKAYQRGDGEKRERFTVVQSMIEAIDRAALDEARIARGEDPVQTVTHYVTGKSVSVSIPLARLRAVLVIISPDRVAGLALERLFNIQSRHISVASSEKHNSCT